MDKYIDINFWVNTQKVDPEDILLNNKISDLLDSNNISLCAVTNMVSVNYDWNIGNERLISNRSLMNNDKILFCFVIVPESYFTFDFKKYIELCLSRKVRIFRLFPRSHLYYLNDYYMRKIYEVLSYYKVPVILDFKQLDITGSKYFATGDLERFLKENRDIDLILECSQKQLMFSRFFYPLLEENDNLFLEVSGLFFMDQIEDMVKKFGSKRFIFGSGYPNLKMDFTIGRMEMSGLDNSDNENISFKNMERILKKIKS